MTVEKWTPERRLERTRVALVAAARQVFATRGFEGASLDEIADAAGYTRGAIYRHFANKEDLFFAVVESIDAYMLDTFAEQLEEEQLGEADNRVDDNRLTAATWIKVLTGNRDLWALNLEYSLYQYRNPAARRRSAEQRRRHLASVATFIEHYTAAQGITLKAPAETVAAILLITSDGFAQAARIDPGTEDHLTAFLDLFLPTVMEPARTT
jgi:AcrR family transcriptional regulator